MAIERDDDFSRDSFNYNKSSDGYFHSTRREKQKDEIKEIIQTNDTAMIEYETVKRDMLKEIKKEFTDAKRIVFFKKVEKRVPIIIEKIIEKKKVDEYGPILPILEEKQVSNPDEKNIRMHRITSKQKKIDYKIKYVNEALPPEPIEVNIILPIGLYAFREIDQRDQSPKAKYLLQSLNLLFEAIQAIQKQLGEPIKVHIGFSVRNDDNFSEQEKKEWITDTYQWLESYVPIMSAFDTKTPTEKKYIDFSIILGKINATVEFTGKTGDSYKRAKNILINIKKKQLSQLSIDSYVAHNVVELDAPLDAGGKIILDGMKDIVKKLFTLSPTK